jgi:hypothetical protein
MRCFSTVAHFAFVVGCSTLLTRATAVSAEELSSTDAIPAAVTTVNKPVPLTPSAKAPHPLDAVLKFARAESGYLTRHVQSWTCRLTKRERIDGELQENNFLDFELQEELRDATGITRPMRLFLTFYAPSEVKGRKVLFIEGQNQGKMLVRKGGKRFNYAIVRIEPNSESAQRESLVPITDMGFSRLLNRQIEVLESHARIDPTGENTKVQHFTNGKINNRPCEVIRITHEKKQSGLQFHEANMYIDNELHVPVRIDASDWPANADEPLPLIAEYTFTDLQLNVDFPEATFDEDRLKD